MNQQDRQAIDAIFQRIGDVERQGTPRDPEAEQLIAEHLRANPAAAYYLAQTVVVQDQALKNVRQEDSVTPPHGDTLSAAGTPLRGATSGAASAAVNSDGLGQGFGRSAPNYAPQQPAMATQFGNSNQAAGAQAAGGGFLAGAAQTAMGVAGGMMLGSMLGNMFGAGHANAADAGKDKPAENNAGNDAAGNETATTETAAADEGGFGSWFGGGDDGGGFDEI